MAGKNHDEKAIQAVKTAGKSVVFVTDDLRLITAVHCWFDETL